MTEKPCQTGKPPVKRWSFWRPGSWPIGWFLGVDSQQSVREGQNMTLASLMGAATRTWIWRSGAVALLLLALVIYVATIVGDRAYRNLQSHYQAQMLNAVARADVIHDICRQRSDMFWDDCAMPSARSGLSDRMVWAMLVSADVIDPLTIAVPFQMREDLPGSDPAAAIVAAWLRDGSRASLTGVPLLVSVATLCAEPGGEAADTLVSNGAAVNGLITAVLADIYEPLPGGQDWLTPEVFRSIGWAPPAWLATAPAEVLEGAWPAPADLRAAVANDATPLTSSSYGERAAPAWQALVRAREGDPRLYLINGPDDPVIAFLGDSISRRALPDQMGDADIVATLFALGRLIDRDSNSFQTDLSDCSQGGGLATDIEALEADQKQALIANFERLGLYIAGQIRISPDVKRARFWVSVYTGHEQRLIFIVAAFGAIVILSRIAVLMLSNLRSASGKHHGALNPFEAPPVSHDQRDNDFDRLASSRWPIRIAVAILPAIGFIGTVRGIMLSLSGADAIVWAETVNQRSAAISSLSADLGLAFATTLLALLFGALLTILVAIEVALGERLLLRRYSRPIYEHTERTNG
jgi:hypothetical protein